MLAVTRSRALEVGLFRLALVIAVTIVVAVAPGAAHARSLFSQYNVEARTFDVYWISGNQHVNVFWYDGNWHWGDITAATGSPVAAANSAISGTSLNSIARTSEAYYVGTNQHVYVLWFDSRLAWFYADLTASIGAPLAAQGTALAAASPGTVSQTAQLYFISTAQHVCKLFYDGAWHWEDASAAAGAPNAVAGSALSVNSKVVNTPAETYYVDANQHLLRLWFDTSWRFSDLSASTGGGNVASGSALDNALNGIANTMEVYFTGPDQNTHLLWRAVGSSGAVGPWNSGGPLNATAGGPGASISGGISSSVVPQAGTLEIYYVTPDQNVGQFLYNGSWSNGGPKGLTGPTSAPLVAVTSGVSSQYNSIARTSEVYVLGANLHYQIFWYNGVWHYSDLTAATGAPLALP